MQLAGDVGEAHVCVRSYRPAGGGRPFVAASIALRPSCDAERAVAGPRFRASERLDRASEVLRPREERLVRAEQHLFLEVEELVRGEERLITAEECLRLEEQRLLCEEQVLFLEKWRLRLVERRLLRAAQVLFLQSQRLLRSVRLPHFR